MISLDKSLPYIWIKAVRRLDAVEIYYSFDDKNYPANAQCLSTGQYSGYGWFNGASPDGKGFLAKFENFSVKHLPDQRRLKVVKGKSGIITLFFFIYSK